MTTKLKALVLSAAIALGSITSNIAQAALSINCTDLKLDSRVDILLGAGPVPNVVSVTIVLGERRLTTVSGQPGEQVVKAQAYDDGEIFRIDLIDQQATKHVAAIRLLRREHDSKPLQIGFVQIENEIPVGISCQGP